MKKHMKKIISFLLTISIVISCSTHIYAEETIEISVKPCPNIDIVSTSGLTEYEYPTLKEDLLDALMEKGVSKSKVNFQTLGTTGHEITEKFTWDKDEDTSIGKISFVNDGRDVSMIGNWTLPGKNAVWYIPEHGYKFDLNFDYNINYGDSFNCAGLLLKVARNNNTLTGYMLTFNNRNTCTTSGTTAAIWKFNWEIGTNSSNIIFSKSSGKPGKNQAFLIKSLALDIAGNLNVHVAGKNIEISGGGLKEMVSVVCEKTYLGSGLGFFSDHYSHGCDLIGSFILKNINLDSVVSKSYSQCLGSPTWRENSLRAIINVEDYSDQNFTSETEFAAILSKTINSNIYYISWGSELNQEVNKSLIKQNAEKGIFIDNTNYQNTINATADYIAKLLDIQSSTQHVIVGQPVELEVKPEELQTNSATVDYPDGRWSVSHNKEFYTNNEGVSSYDQQYLNDLELTFDKPGEYKIYFEKRLVKTVYAHRLPSASFGTSIDEDNKITITSYSYDLDNDDDLGYGSGIAEEEWKYKKITDADWILGKPSQLEEDSSYIIQLRVKDNQEQWSNPYTQHVSTNKSIVLKPVANFTIKSSTISKRGNLGIVDLSYDPNGLEISNKKWTLKQGSSILAETSEPITDFSSYDVGFYTYELVTTNSSGMESDTYTIAFNIIDDIYINAPEEQYSNKSINIAFKILDVADEDGKYSYAIDTNDIVDDNTAWGDVKNGNSGSFNISGNGTYYAHIKIINPDNSETYKTIGPYTIDRGTPQAKFSLEETEEGVLITITAFDDSSGIDKIKLPDNTIYKNSNTYNMRNLLADNSVETTFLAKENDSYCFTVYDNAGNLDVFAINMNAHRTNINKTSSIEDIKYDELYILKGTDYFADEDTNVWVTEDEVRSINEITKVSVFKESQFTITIPKEIIVDAELLKADYEVNAKGDISGDQEITVIPDTEFLMSENGGKNDITAIVEQPDTKYTYEDLLGEGTTYSGKIITEAMTAGEWVGRFNFTITLKGSYSTGELTPGLYTDGTLMVEWTPLLEGEIINVSEEKLVAGNNTEELSNSRNELVIDETVHDISEFILGGETTGIKEITINDLKTYFTN